MRVYSPSRKIRIKRDGDQAYILRYFPDRFFFEIDTRGVSREKLEAFSKLVRVTLEEKLQKAGLAGTTKSFTLKPRDPQEPYRVEIHCSPKHINKADLIQFLAEKFRTIKYVVTAGDSLLDPGNDKPMLSPLTYVADGIHRPNFPVVISKKPVTAPLQQAVSTELNHNPFAEIVERGGLATGLRRQMAKIRKFMSLHRDHLGASPAAPTGGMSIQTS